MFDVSINWMISWTQLFQNLDLHLRHVIRLDGDTWTEVCPQMAIE